MWLDVLSWLIAHHELVEKVAHHMSLPPLFVLAAVVACGKGSRVKMEALVAGTLAISAIGTTAQGYMDGSSIPQTPVIAAQVAVLCCAFAPIGMKALSAWGVTALFFFSLTVSPDGSEWVVTLFGSGAVLYLARHQRIGVRVPLWIYFSAASLLYLRMNVPGHYYPAWYWYQGCRLAAIIALIAATVHSSRRGER